MTRPVRPNDLYASDYALWLDGQVAALERGDVAALDLANLADEVGDLGRSERDAIASNLTVILIHLLKWRHQPSKRKRGWEASIAEHRKRIRRQLERSPSLRNHPEEVLQDEYEIARLRAAAEMGVNLSALPEACPFSIDQVLDPGFLPGPSLLDPR